MGQLHCWSKDFDLATRHRQIGNCWRHAWYIKDGLIWRETKVHRCLCADSMCSEKFTVFRTRSSRKTVSLEEHMMMGAYFRAKWRLLNCRWTILQRAGKKITNTLLFPEFFNVLKYDLMNRHMSIFCNNQKTLSVVNMILKFWAKCMKSASLNWKFWILMLWSCTRAGVWYAIFMFITWCCSLVVSWYNRGVLYCMFHDRFLITSVRLLELIDNLKVFWKLFFKVEPALRWRCFPHLVFNNCFNISVFLLVLACMFISNYFMFQACSLNTMRLLCTAPKTKVGW